MTFNDIFPQQRKKQRGGGCRKRRRALKKSPRALQSNTAGFEKKAAGFGNRHGGLCDETPQALKTETLPVMSESLPVSRCACVVSPKAYSLPGLRVWFHQKFTRHPELCPVRLRCSIPPLQPNLPPHRIYFRAVSTFRNVLQTELLQTRTNPDGASYKTFNHILGVIINYHYE